MNEFDYEEHGYDIPPRPPEDPRPPRRRQSGRSAGWSGGLTLLFSLLALVLAAGALFLALRGGEEEPPPAVLEPPTVEYRGLFLPVLEGVPVNEYSLSGFSLDERDRIVYALGEVRAKTGVDVSYAQGEGVDWQAVAADGIEFAILRLGYRGYTEGGLLMDRCFAENFQGALDAGLEVGVYFFSQAITPEEAEEEARFVLDQLACYDVGEQFTYPIVYDFEYYSSDKEARTAQVDGQTLTQCAAAFCAVIDQAGYTPAVYFNQELGYLSYDLSQLSQYPFWMADYDGTPDFYYHFYLWQYSHTGTVAGIEGDVDLDLDFSPLLAG